MRKEGELLPGHQPLDGLEGVAASNFGFDQRLAEDR
jgi:hypothetical protein